MQTPERIPPIRHYAKPIAAVAVLLLSCLAGYFWYGASGRITLTGVLANSDFLLVAGQAGTAASVEARPGDIVTVGQPLLRFDNSALRENLEKERQHLIQLARMLPPEHIRLPDPDDLSVGNETLTRRLARKGAAEREAIKVLQRATEGESAAATAYNTVAKQLGKGKTDNRQLQEAESVLLAARETLRKARDHKEAITTQRATAESAIRRVLEYHEASGANKVPLKERLGNYEAQRKVVEGLARSVSVAYLAAPFEGTILEVMVQPGKALTESTHCFVLQPSVVPLLLSCSAEVGKALRLHAGLQCEVSFPAHGDEKYQGFIAEVEGESDSALREVKVGVIRRDDERERIPAGSGAEVTVLLRTSPLTEEYMLSLMEGGRGGAGRDSNAGVSVALPTQEKIDKPLIGGRNENVSPPPVSPPIIGHGVKPAVAAMQDGESVPVSHAPAVLTHEQGDVEEGQGTPLSSISENEDSEPGSALPISRVVPAVSPVRSIARPPRPSSLPVAPHRAVGPPRIRQ